MRCDIDTDAATYTLIVYFQPPVDAYMISIIGTRESLTSVRPLRASFLRARTECEFFGSEYQIIASVILGVWPDIPACVWSRKGHK